MSPVTSVPEASLNCGEALRSTSRASCTPISAGLATFSPLRRRGGTTRCQRLSGKPPRMRVHGFALAPIRPPGAFGIPCCSANRVERSAVPLTQTELVSALAERADLSKPS